MKKLLLGVMLLLLSTQIFAAAAYDTVSFTQGTNSTFTFSHTCTGNDLVLLVFVTMERQTQTVSSITYNGDALTFVRRDTTAVNTDITQEVWKKVDPATGANDIVVTLTGSVDTVIGAQSYTGVSDVGANTGNAGASPTNALSTTITTTADNSYLVGVVAQERGGVTITMYPDMQLRYAVQTGGGVGDMYGSGFDRLVTSTGDYILGFTSSSAVGSAISAVELLEFIATPTVTPTITETFEDTLTVTPTVTPTRTNTPDWTRTITPTLTITPYCSLYYGGTGLDRFTDSLVDSRTNEQVIVGYSDSEGYGDSDVWIRWQDLDGTLLEEKFIGGTEFDAAYAISEHPTDGWVLVGQTDSFGVTGQNIYVVRVNAEYNVVWQKYYGASGNARGAHIKEITSDGEITGYVIVGYTNDFTSGNLDAYIIITDVEGNCTNSHTYGSTWDDEFTSVEYHEDENHFHITGYKSVASDNKDGWVAVIDATSLAILDENTYGGDGNDVIYDWDTSEEDPDVSYCYGTYTNSSLDFWFLRVGTESLSLLSSHTYGGSGVEYGYRGVELNGNIYISGSTSSYGAGGLDAYVVWAETDGTELRTWTFGGPNDDEIYDYITINAPIGEIHAYGYTESYGSGQADGWILCGLDPQFPQIPFTATATATFTSTVTPSPTITPTATITPGSILMTSVHSKMLHVTIDTEGGTGTATWQGQFPWTWFNTYPFIQYVSMPADSMVKRNYTYLSNTLSFSVVDISDGITPVDCSSTNAVFDVLILAPLETRE